jgi:hypothetical protein
MRATLRHGWSRHFSGKIKKPHQNPGNFLAIRAVQGDHERA